MLKIKTILHPTDFSSFSENAFHLAASLARDHGSRLILLHVRRPPETVMGEFGMLPPSPTPDGDEADEKLAQMTCPDFAVKLERLVVEGNPAEKILAAARAAQCDMIVMGSHGGSRLADLLLGSVSARVLREAECPVLVVKAPVKQNYTVDFRH